MWLRQAPALHMVRTEHECIPYPAARESDGTQRQQQNHIIGSALRVLEPSISKSDHCIKVRRVEKPAGPMLKS